MGFLGGFGLLDLALLEFLAELSLLLRMFQCLAEHRQLFQILLFNQNLLVTQYSLAEPCVPSNHLKVLDDKALDNQFSLDLV